MPQRQNKITMSDIARASGVSLSTVSLALNDKPGLPDETRARVINAARDLGYEIRDNLPVITRPAWLQTIGVLVKRAQGDSAPPSSNIFFSDVIAGIEAGCRQENLTLLYSTLLVDANDWPMEVPRLVNDLRVDGLLLVGNYIDEQLDDALRRRGIPVGLVEAFGPEQPSSTPFDSILIDNEEGAYLAVQHLVQHGHRHIAFVGSTPESKISFRYRRQGYARALADCGIPNAYYADCPHNQREAVIAAARRLLEEQPQVTAMFGCNDEVAVLSIHGALAAGKRVPEDISIVGFDDNANAQNSLPPLTSLRVDKAGMGRLAVQMIAQRAANPELGCVTLRLHTRLVQRRSVQDLR